MHYIVMSFGKTCILLLISLVIVGIVVGILDDKLFHGRLLFPGSTVLSGILGVVLLVVTAMVASTIDDAYAFVHPHHLHYTDQIKYYDPYFWGGAPYNATYCTSEGDIITEEECLELYHKTHVVVLDTKGNVIATYPKENQ